MSTTTQASPPSLVKIGIWGPPASGKTTYLAALRVAATRLREQGLENWIMNGADDGASQFLTDSTQLLTRAQRFPEANAAAQELAFRFIGEQEVTRGLFKKKVEIVRRMFDLDMLDVPGGVFGAPVGADDFAGADDADDDGLDFGDASSTSRAPTSAVAPEVEERLLDHLQQCDGIIYLFDPVRDAREGDAYEYFHRVLEKLTRRVFEQPDYAGTRLPHHVAVCVTKFDDPSVFELAARLGFVEQDHTPPYLPRVREGARSFFARLCQESAGRNADLVDGSLQQYFYPDRLHYFVTSSVGFHVSGGRFKREDYHNIVRDEQGRFGIRDRIYPIDVLEPVLWLQAQLHGNA